MCVCAPELIESAMYLFRATGDHTYLQLGLDAVESIEKIARTPCGYATVPFWLLACRLMRFVKLTESCSTSRVLTINCVLIGCRSKTCATTSWTTGWSPSSSPKPSSTSICSLTPTTSCTVAEHPGSHRGRRVERVDSVF